MERVFKYEEQLFVVETEKFGETNFCETYGDYGQKNNCTDCGCYSWENEYVRGYYLDELGYSKEDLDEQELEGLEKKFKEEKEESHVTCTAYTFWNGHNWETVVMEFDNYPLKPDLEEIEEELEQEILQDSEIAERITPRNSCVVKKKGKKYVFTYYNTYGFWQEWRVEEIEEEEEEEK